MSKQLFIGILLVLTLNPTLAYSNTCYERLVTFPSPFMGNDGELVKLDDGTYWLVQGSHEYLYSYYPNAILCPDRGLLVVEGSRIQVVDMAGPVIESAIVNDFDGLEFGNIYRLANGQIWEQTEHWAWIWMWANPRVVIYPYAGGYKMLVENIEKSVFVARLR